MPTVLKCPQCEALVRVSEEVGVNSLVQCPQCEEEFLLGEFQEPQLPELLIVKAVPEPSAESDKAVATAETAAFDLSIPEEAVEEPVGIWGQDEAPPEESEVDTEADSAEDIPVPAAEEEAEFSVQGKIRRRKEANIGAFLFMSVLGGALGLLVTYYGLCWTGFAGGLPKLPLPLLPHTMQWNDAVLDYFRGRNDGSEREQPASEDASSS